MSGPEISVKAYAARAGMTEQAVYKQIKSGKLRTVKRREHGKVKTYILSGPQLAPDPQVDLPGSQAAAPDPGAARSAEEQPPRAVPEPGTTPERAADPTAAALEKAVAALTAQLEEKDKQIARLQELLNQSQQLQAHSQRLLEQGPERAADLQAVENPQEREPEQEEKPERPKKRSFFAWLFGTEESQWKP